MVLWFFNIKQERLLSENQEITSVWRAKELLVKVQSKLICDGWDQVHLCILLCKVLPPFPTLSSSPGKSLSPQLLTAHGESYREIYTLRELKGKWFHYFHNYGIIKLFDLEGSFKSQLVQHPWNEQGRLQLEQVSLSSIQPDLECLLRGNHGGEYQLSFAYGGMPPSYFPFLTVCCHCILLTQLVQISGIL